jgi:3-hydroxyisobutyrate dehydrogenase
VCDFSTIDPGAAAAIARRMRDDCGVGWVDAPVSGGVPAAEAGSLIVFAGGDATDIATARPLFEAVSKKVTHMGPSGAGQATKVCNQMIVSANMLVLAETFATARAAGIDVGRLTAALAGAYADSQPLQIYGPRMAARHYEPRQSSIAIMAKDAGLAQKMARSAGVETPMGALAASLYDAARNRPEVDFNGDISALVELYETAGKDPKSQT